MSHLRPRRLQVATLAILVAAAVFRIWATEHARFTGDESDHFAKSRRLALLEHVPAFGPSITGSDADLPGPLYYYFIAIPQAFGPSPRLGSIFVALGHILAGWLLVDLARRSRGERAACVAALLFAFAPWDVLYADRIWGSAIVPIFGTSAIYAAARSHASSRAQGILAFIVLVLPQLHMSSPVLWATCAALVVFFPPRAWNWRAVAIGGAIATLCYVPPLIAEISTDFANTRKIVAHSGGHEPWSYAVLHPVRVFASAILDGTSDISYHFARGYWSFEGGFDWTQRYATMSGWKDAFRARGFAMGAANVLSIVLASLAWVFALVRCAPSFRRERRVAIDLERAMTLALVLGLGCASILLVVARKPFFPHYANVLMPMLLWPVAMSIDRALDVRRLRVSVLLVFAASLVGMAASTIAYYRTVDSKNGLGATMRMVEHVLREGEPIDLRFDHFDNGYAWRQIAALVFDRTLELQRDARVVYRVHNAPNHVPKEGAISFGSVELGRSERPKPSDPPDLVARARDDLVRIRVERIDRNGSVRGCAPRGDGTCAYGDNAWQHFGRETMTMGDRAEPVLFLHPVADEIVRATIPRPDRAVRAVLRYGLSDGALASSNRSPVRVRVIERDRVVAEVAANNERGLRAHAFPLDPTAGSISLELRAEVDGSRVFGFDIEFYARE